MHVHDMYTYKCVRTAPHTLTTEELFENTEQYTRVYFNESLCCSGGGDDVCAYYYKAPQQYAVF